MHEELVANETAWDSSEVDPGLGSKVWPKALLGLNFKILGLETVVEEKIRLTLVILGRHCLACSFL